MKWTRLVLAAALLALLGGLIWWSNKKEAATVAKPDSGAPRKILSLDSSALTSFTIQHRNQDRLTAIRQNSAWQITSPKPLATDQEAVSNLLSALSALSSEHLVEDQAADLAPYGLTAPDLELALTLKDSKTQKLLIGDQTPAGGAYYAAVAGDPRVFTIAGYAKSNLDKSATDLRDKRLLTADFDKVSQIELVNQKGGKKKEITFARSKEAWQILKPTPARADSSQVDQLISTLRDEKMDISSSDDQARIAASFKSAAPFADVKLNGASGTQNLEIRKSKDKEEYYAKSSEVAGIYKVASGTGLDKTLEDFANKRLFDFGYQDPDKIEFHDGANSYFFTRSGSDWWGADGKKLDADTIDRVVERLRNLAATKFPESGFATPSLQVVVTSNSGKRAERVAIATHGKTFIAKRESEPALYELSANLIQELLDAVAKVKPAAISTPPAKK